MSARVGDSKMLIGGTDGWRSKRMSVGMAKT